ncbi:hypothetical protein LAZ67_12001800 [Cordylochernes scorpioides]|uniref:Reverse transcriptase domain-containing protein n=1 Tax=Cordylochernes scorpioides TaxID=51811 RepID=A0ABY6L245_9ARAC|nr:hypothetical protein LAZ67_12001800 [Cordylochernes scorpioides]
MQDIGMLLWQGLGPYIHNSQYVPPFVQVDSRIPILLCGDFNKNHHVWYLTDLLGSGSEVSQEGGNLGLKLICQGVLEEQQQLELEHRKDGVKTLVSTRHTVPPTFRCFLTLLTWDLASVGGLRLLRKRMKLSMSISVRQKMSSIYRSHNGLPMGNPISSAFANIFMNEIDKQIINSNQFKIILWLRYIDDIFCLTEIDIDSFIRFLNSLKPFLKFTYEKESNNSLAFLDIQLKRNQYNIETCIYRKPTHTGNYLNFSSFGPIHNKIAVVKSLSKRIETHHSNRNSATEERNRIFKELINNNYPKKFIEKHFYKQRYTFK